MIIAGDGYIISAMGLNLGDYQNIDASMAKHIMMNNREGVTDCLKPNYLLIVDRGFWDCLPLLNIFGYKTNTPAFLTLTVLQGSYDPGSAVYYRKEIEKNQGLTFFCINQNKPFFTHILIIFPFIHKIISSVIHKFILQNFEKFTPRFLRISGIVKVASFSTVKIKQSRRIIYHQ